KAGGDALENAHKSVDTLVYTWLVMVLLILISFLATRGIKKMPGGLQNFMEVVVGGVENMITDTMGTHGKPFYPLIATLALFILVSNLLSLIPGFFPPTASVNTNAACAVIVFLTTHVVGFQMHGFKYLKHFIGPIIWLAPMIFFIEIIGHFSRIISLTLRLFGNIGGHEIMIMVFFALVPFFVPLIMTVLGLLVCFIQAFVFMLLTMIYIQGSLEEAH
ncbi:MAG TPA: F0F1 ATP synthase subunit A, partial [Geobacteraceae bacterium]|nr:F0F1 ATP synthase subunit A [Geobacteraceae bacterium]